MDPTTPGAWFYDNSIIGDVVVVQNTGWDHRPGRWLNGWNMDWEQWKAGSAL
ncbi:Lipoprotein OS=Streptomyces griseomycini OX=66895 GN=FHS37_001349 PE=4 SV=1 [Streptomyces griseomycini]